MMVASLAEVARRGSDRRIGTAAVGPARDSEVSACRHDGLVSRLREAGLAAIADLGFVDLDDDTGDPAVITGCQELARADQVPPRREVGYAAGVGAADPQPARDRPLTGDLHAR